MTWYAASVVVVTKLRDGIQTEFPVYENVYLIEANNDEEASENAETMGKLHVIDDQTLTLDGKPARDEFLGIRKLITIVNPFFPKDPSSEQPHHGTEVTYSRYTVKGEANLKKLAQGARVPIMYEE